jgi:hypothetical protein
MADVEFIRPKAVQSKTVPVISIATFVKGVINSHSVIKPSISNFALVPPGYGMR